jgi:osmotically-inducible protein OsmY
MRLIRPGVIRIDRIHQEQGKILRRMKSLSIDDQAVSARVLNNLRRSAVVESPPDLRISVSAGVVRLEGSVFLPAEKAVIEELVRLTEGVLAVENALRILPCSARRSR